MMAACSILVRVQSTVSCMNVLSNDKQVILYSYFIASFQHWSNFHLFRASIIKPYDVPSAPCLEDH